MKKAFLLVTVLIALLVGLTVLPGAAGAASMKQWSLDIASSLAPLVADTSQTLSTSGYGDMYLYVAFEGDSATSTIQGSTDGATWVTLSSIILNGTDGTYAMQFYGPLVKTGGSITGAGTLSEFLLPPLNYTRYILNCHDKAGSDSLGTITAKLYANR